MKRLVIFFGMLFVLFFTYGCSNKTDDSTDLGNTEVKTEVKSTSYYKEVWDNSFKHYQTTKTLINETGLFDFDLELYADGDSDYLMSIMVPDAEGDFNSLSLKLYGDYNLIEGETSINISFKAYLNKRNVGLGDIDISLSIDSEGLVTYYLNNIDRTILEFMGLSDDYLDGIMIFYDKNKNIEITNQVDPAMISEIAKAIREESENTPLYQNTQDQEQQIIDAFLDKEVIKVLSGITIDDDLDRVNFKFDSDNFIDYMNEVAQILGGENSQKTFDNEKDLFKNLIVDGYLDIQDNLIMDSLIKSKWLVMGENKDTGELQGDTLNVNTVFKMPSAENIYFEFQNTIAADNSLDNRITITFKGLIK